MKIGMLIAGAVVAGVMFVATPSQAKAAGPAAGAKAGEVKDELKELKAAVEALRKAKEAGDKAGEKAAIKNIITIWKELPAKVKEHVLKKHPELAKIIERIEKHEK